MTYFCNYYDCNTQRNCLTEDRLILAYDFIGIWSTVLREACQNEWDDRILWSFLGGQ